MRQQPRGRTRVAARGAIAAAAMFALALPAAAAAAPTVTFKAKVAPIPKNLKKRHSSAWPGTGDMYGKPAAVEGTFKIAGSEYPSASEGWTAGTLLGVGPAPLRRVMVYLPRGTKINSKPFKTCPLSKFENHLEPPCPRGSLASPPGEADGKVFFGETVVREKVTVQAYFTQGGKLTFWIEGKSPASIEQYATGGVASIPGPFSKRLTSTVPLISTVTGAPDAMAQYIRIRIGAARKIGRRLVSYGYVPNRCPKGGFPTKAELWFGGGAESSWQKVTVTTKAACPRGRPARGHGHRRHKGHRHG